MTAAIGTTTKTMQAVNKQMDPQKMAKTMQDFGKANMQMEMGEEMSEAFAASIISLSFLVNDTLDSMLDESGDEAEQDAIVTQVGKKNLNSF
jgi:charged multivesicular body protein 2B